MIHFQATVVLTPEVLHQIRERVRDYMSKSLMIDDFDADQLDTVDEVIRQCFAMLVQENSKPITNGYKLDTDHILKVAQSLRAGMKIQAIKDFREATGADLRSAKNTIDQFGLGKGSAEIFLTTYMA